MRLAAILFAALLVAGPPALAKEESKIQTDLEVVTPGGGPPPRGSVRLKLQGSEATFHLKVKRLAASTEYVVTADGVEQTRFTTNAKGDANEKMDLHTVSMGTLAPFDPRGKLVGVALETAPGSFQNVLEAVVSGASEPPRTKVKEWTDLAPDAGAPGAAGDARFDQRPNGNRRFVVKASGLAPNTSHDVHVDGSPVGTLVTNGGGAGKAHFEAKKNGKSKGKKKQALGVDPRGLLVEVFDATTLMLSGPMLAQIDGISVCAPSQTLVALTNEPGVLGTGTAEFEVEDDCDRSFEVELDDVTPDTYDVFVGGADVGDLVAVDIGSGGDGTLAFDTDPDDPGEQLLDFDPRGQAVEVRLQSDGSLVMSGALP
jgi:hypothetical protein